MSDTGNNSGTVNQASNQAGVESQVSSDSSASVMIIVLVFLVLVIAAGIGAWYYFSSTPTTTPAVPVKSVTTTPDTSPGATPGPGTGGTPGAGPGAGGTPAPGGTTTPGNSGNKGPSVPKDTKKPSVPKDTKKPSVPKDTKKPSVPKDTKKPKDPKPSPAKPFVSVPSPITGDVGSFTWASLPPPSQNDKNWCHTWMSDSNDDGSCFALMYHHCLDGYKDESKIPPAVRNAKSSVMKQTYALGGGTYTDKKSKKTWTKFPTPPSQWSSVCVARQDLAGKGKCSKVTKDEWRYWIMANDPNRTSECQKESSLYVKSHVRSAKVQDCCVGNHGHG